MYSKSKIILLIVTLFVFSNVKSQQKEISIAKNYELIGRFSLAIQYYKKAEAREKYLAEEERVELYKSLIFCYDKIKDTKASVKVFEKIEDLQPLSDSLAIKYSEVLRTEGDYREAEKVYLNVVKMQSDKDLKRNMLATLSAFKRMKSQKQPYDIEKTNIDVQGLSMGVQEYKEGLIIGMPTTTEGLTYYNLGYCTTKDSIKFSAPTLLSKNLTSKFYEGYPALDKANNILYFTSNSLSKVKVKKGGKKDVGNEVNRLKIYRSVWQDNDWSKKEELPFNSMDYSCLHPSISKDGNTMYFTSDKSGGIGGYDIFKVEKTNSGWSSPINMGAKVNSIGDEMNPFIHGDILYFSSRGFFGFGGIDVFRVDLSVDEPVVENLGAPINTAYDDFSFTMNDNDKGYVSSNRSSKKAEDEIYSFVYYPVNVVKDAEDGSVVEDIDVTISEMIDGKWKQVSLQRTNKSGEWKYEFKEGVGYKVKFDNSYRNSKEFELTASGNREKELQALQNVDMQRVFIDGYVIDEETKKGIEGVKEVLYEKDELGEFNEIDSTFTDEEGYWRFDVEKDKVYEVEIQRVDYELQKIKIEPLTDNEIKRKTYNTELKVLTNKEGEKILGVDNILFELNSATITKESFPILDQVVTYLKANPYSKLEIGAFTDCSGNDADNLQLSKERAASCANYVIEKIGGKAFRVKHKGYGETKPLNSCEEQNADPKIAALNRRVEFKLVK
jgi:outer membrane protein OmpA-like peptidoglycan-associated protein